MLSVVGAPFREARVVLQHGLSASLAAAFSRYFLRVVETIINRVKNRSEEKLAGTRLLKYS